LIFTFTNEQNSGITTIGGVSTAFELTDSAKIDRKVYVIVELITAKIHLFGYYLSYSQQYQLTKIQ